MAQSTNMIDPSEYRAFCFRGEGRCNFVISAKIVWRLAKHRKSGTISTKPKSHVVNAYLDEMISRFLTESYLIKAELIYLPVDVLHYIAKIPSLPHNLKIENWQELTDENRYPPSMSFFPKQSTPEFIYALQMPDATRIPNITAITYGSIITTVEIKPKQGFYQSHPGVNVPFCNNCILQIEKWRSFAFEKMYDFCPLELYSGQRDRMHAAIESLIREPHRNLRIFADGDVIHDEVTGVLSRDELSQALFPHGGANVDTLVSTIACALAGVEDDTQETFSLRGGCVLSELITAQQLDPVGIVKARELMMSLPANIQRELRNKSNLLNRRDHVAFLKRTDARSLVERYLLAATLKDCSLMVSVRLIEASGLTTSDGLSKGKGTIRVKSPNGHTLHFAYSIRIVDLDPKTSKNLESAYQRFMAGVHYLQANPSIHQPCNIYTAVTSTTFNELLNDNLHFLGSRAYYFSNRWHCMG